MKTSKINPARIAVTKSKKTARTKSKKIKQKALTAKQNPAETGTKPAETETPAQVAAAGADKAKPQEPLAPVEELILPIDFLAAALAIAPKNDARAYLNGVRIHQLADNQIRIASTDGHRLFVASIEHDIEIAWARAGVTLPREELERIVKYVGKKVLGLRIEFGVDHPRLTIHEIDGIAQFTIVPIEGRYPDYQAIIDRAASVFTAERDDLDVSAVDSTYLKSAAAIAAQLDSRSVMPFMSTDFSVPSVFRFDQPNVLLYIAGRTDQRQALPAPTVRLIGEKGMAGTLAALKAHETRTRAAAEEFKNTKKWDELMKKADGYAARAAEIRQALTPQLAAPTPTPAPIPTPTAPEAASIH